MTHLYALPSQQVSIIIIIMLVLLITITLVSYSNKTEGISIGAQRFASVRSEGYYGSGLSPANYNGENLNFESTKNTGNVITSMRGNDTA
jgi:hypothetical protein